MMKRTLQLGTLAAALMFAAGSANAAIIAVFGNNSNSSVVSFLNTNGHTATDYGTGAPSAAQLASADVAIALRANGNADVEAFVLGGGLLITEWSAADWALDVVSLLDADGGGNSFIGSNSPVTHTADGLALGLGTGLSNPYADGPRTEFQWTLANIGAGVDVLATIGSNVPAIIGGIAGLGYALINSLDWADSFPVADSPSGTWLLNAVSITPGGQSQQVPEPMTLALVGLGLAGLGFMRRRGA